jgi:hypothetical protein
LSRVSLDPSAIENLKEIRRFKIGVRFPIQATYARVPRRNFVPSVAFFQETSGHGFTQSQQIELREVG